MDYKNIFSKALEKLFPEQDKRAEAELILSEYGVESFHREGQRVKAAILKVAGGDIDEVKRCTEIACCDYRDMLFMAEYPNQCGRSRLEEKDPVRGKVLVKRDFAQYKKWVDSMVAE